ncbi:hypothetical protein TNIN_10531 [Trichonephila inaurata madagascariensis]|uniref:Uncharacterized protein n=1 Tax=Trichonephila inaurata madagascariensis TaxID=2747483 RepID=A0A8X6WNM5_9ARAC|nr:hypothetical protein TNIN_10531 [Trichonephila inaurata madagascariensis]
MDMILDRQMNTDSGTPSRPSTPILSPQCQRWIFLNAEIQKFTFLAQGIESSLESIRRFGTVDENDSYVIKARTELKEYNTLLSLTVSEFNSLPLCDLPGCPQHHTPLSSPSKNSVSSQITLNDNESISAPTKTFPLKRKEINDDGFITPPISKVNKTANCTTQQNFNSELRNKFKNLIEEPTRISTETSAFPRQPTQSQQPVKNLPPQ